jgi:hypothetical protein
MVAFAPCFSLYKKKLIQRDFCRRTGVHYISFRELEDRRTHPHDCYDLVNEASGALIDVSGISMGCHSEMLSGSSPAAGYEDICTVAESTIFDGENFPLNKCPGDRPSSISIVYEPAAAEHGILCQLVHRCTGTAPGEGFSART